MLFVALILFSVATVLMVPFLTNYPSMPCASPRWRCRAGLRVGPLILSLLATFLFQAGNMAVYAYVIGLGQSAGLSMQFIGPALAAAAWIGIAGAGLVIVMSTRFGRVDR